MQNDGSINVQALERTLMTPVAPMEIIGSVRLSSPDRMVMSQRAAISEA